MGSKQTPFGTWLLAECNRRGWSQSDLAGRAEISTGLLSNYINGHRKPKLDKLQKIATAFNYDLSYVAARANPDFPEHELSELERLQGLRLAHTQMGYTLGELEQGVPPKLATALRSMVGSINAHNEKLVVSMEEDVVETADKRGLGDARARFALRVDGIGLESLLIGDGDLIVCEAVDPTRPLEQDNLLVVRINSEHRLVRCHLSGEMIELCDGAGRVVARMSEIEPEMLVGVMVELYRKTKRDA